MKRIRQRRKRKENLARCENMLIKKFLQVELYIYIYTYILLFVHWARTSALLFYCDPCFVRFSKVSSHLQPRGSASGKTHRFATLYPLYRLVVAVYREYRLSRAVAMRIRPRVRSTRSARAEDPVRSSRTSNLLEASKRTSGWSSDFIRSIANRCYFHPAGGFAFQVDVDPKSADLISRRHRETLPVAMERNQPANVTTRRERIVDESIL